MTKLFIRIALVLSLPLGIASSATAQGSATATTPAKVTPVVAAKIVPSVPTSPSKGDEPTAKVAPPVTTAQAQPQTIDPKAQAIFDKSVAVVRGLKAVQLTTKLTASGSDAGMMPAEFLDPTNSTWDLEHVEGSPCKRMRIESMKNDKAARAIIFDGAHSLAIDNASKTYREGDTNWPSLLGTAGAGVPQWVLEKRQEEAMPAKFVAASIVGEETIDGQPCDIVLVSRAIVVGASPDGGEQTPVTMTTTDTIAVARSDSFPRRISQKMEINGENQMGNMSFSFQYSNVKLDPTLDASMFSVVPPAGYTKGEQPKEDGDGDHEQCVPGAAAEPAERARRGTGSRCGRAASRTAATGASAAAPRGRISLHDSAEMRRGKHAA